jgi:hypothetical protein
LELAGIKLILEDRLGILSKSYQSFDDAELLTGVEELGSPFKGRVAQPVRRLGAKCRVALAHA